MKNDIYKQKRKPGEIIPLTYDLLFTMIFNDPNNIDIVESFLSAYFNEDIEKIKGNVLIKSRDLKLTSKKDKKKQVDLILDLNGEKINVELNNDLEGGKEDRNLIYAARVHIDQLKRGERNYLKINRTLQINLNNFNSNESKLRETYYLRNEEGKTLSKKFQIDFVDLAKADEKLYNEEEERLAKWCKAIRCKTEKGLKKELGEDLMVKETKEKLLDEVNKYSDDEEVYALYSDYTQSELERNGLIELIEIAKEKNNNLQTLVTETNEKLKGVKEENNNLQTLVTETNEKLNEISKEKDELLKQMEEKNTEIVKNMLNKNIDINLISEITGLSTELIKKLMKKNRDL